MNKRHFRITVLAVLLLWLGNTASAQQTAPKLTPPKLQSFWGFTKGGELPLEMVLNVLDSAVWAIDANKVRYPISRFMILFRSKDRFEDDETGEIKSRFNSNVLQVKNNGFLPEQWRKQLFENVKKEDELLIVDIIVRDKKGNFFKAPDIKIVVQ